MIFAISVALPSTETLQLLRDYNDMPVRVFCFLVEAGQRSYALNWVNFAYFDGNDDSVPVQIATIPKSTEVSMRYVEINEITIVIFYLHYCFKIAVRLKLGYAPNYENLTSKPRMRPLELVCSQT